MAIKPWPPLFERGLKDVIAECPAIANDPFVSEQIWRILNLLTGGGDEGMLDLWEFLVEPEATGAIPGVTYLEAWRWLTRPDPSDGKRNLALAIRESVHCLRTANAVHQEAYNKIASWMLTELVNRVYYEAVIGFRTRSQEPAPSPPSGLVPRFEIVR